MTISKKTYKIGGKEYLLTLENLDQERCLRVSLSFKDGDRPFFQYNEYLDQIDTKAEECYVPDEGLFREDPDTEGMDFDPKMNAQEWVVKSSDSYVDETLMREIKNDIYSFRTLEEDTPDELIEEIREFLDNHILKVFRAAADEAIEG